MSFKQKRILMKTFVRSPFEVMLIYECQKKQILIKTFLESHFRVMVVYEFQTKANFSEHIF